VDICGEPRDQPDTAWSIHHVAKHRRPRTAWDESCGCATMLLPRGLYSNDPPAPRTRQQNQPTLLFSWWCTCFSLAIIFVRLVGRMVRNNQLFKEDKLMFASIVPLMTRMALVHVILIWGTNNVDTSMGLNALDIKHRAIGSRLVLASRIFYAM
jgi:hypothetical protein